MAKAKSSSGQNIPKAAQPSVQTQITNWNKFIAKYGNNPKYAKDVASAKKKLAAATGQPVAPAPAPAPADPSMPSSTELGINDKTGRINSDVAAGTIVGAEVTDVGQNFKMNNPGQQTDALGNSQTITRDPVTGEVTKTQTGGAGITAANQAFVGAATDFGANGKSAAQQAADANYNYLTRNVQGDKAQEMEAQKQMLAERGIPIDPSPGSLWSKSLESIDRKYQNITDQANQQAIASRDSSYATQAGVLNTLGSTVAGQTPTFTPYQGATQDTSGALGQTLNTAAGTNAQIAANNAAVKSNEYIANAQIAAKRRTGGGASTEPIIGGIAP